MADRLRVYHPETGEPFDLPVAKANDLRLEHGWLSHPLDPDAEPAVKTVPLLDHENDEVIEADDEEGWDDEEPDTFQFDDPVAAKAPQRNNR